MLSLELQAVVFDNFQGILLDCAALVAVESGYIRSQCGSELEMDVVLFLGPAPDPEERGRHVLIIGSLP